MDFMGMDGALLGFQIDAFTSDSDLLIFNEHRFDWLKVLPSASGIRSASIWTPFKGTFENVTRILCSQGVVYFEVHVCNFLILPPCSKSQQIKKALISFPGRFLYFCQFFIFSKFPSSNCIFTYGKACLMWDPLHNFSKSKWYSWKWILYRNV